MSQPSLSIIVVVYNMQREAPRTLHSLSTAYQQGVEESDYEVIVVENGSQQRLDGAEVQDLPGHFRYFYLEDPPPSPAYAINFGVHQSHGRNVGVMIDGARVLTPGVVRWALRGLQLFDNVLVETMGFHLGPEGQAESVLKGYNQEREDELLQSIHWPRDGYRLFEISSLAASSRFGWYRPIFESNAFFMARSLFDELEGYDERFVIPGGGLVNLDFYARACAVEGLQVVRLLGEGSFHQVHTSATASQPAAKMHSQWDEFEDEYRRIRGQGYKNVPYEPVHLGEVRPAAIPWLRNGCEIYDVDVDAPKSS